MDQRLFELKLTNHKMFKDLKLGLDENPVGKLRNLMEFRDDVLYVWNSIENYLMCLNVRHLEESDEETPYQKLHFLTPPSFQVERLLSSPCGARVCVWGARGASIAELPARWGRGGLFDSGKESVLCKSCSVDERFLYSQGEVRKVAWHPSSLSHLLVLVSDNTIRLYNIALKAGPKLVKCIPIGPKPHTQLAGSTLLDSLGDTAVDFSTTSEGDVLVLRGNGDVYVVDCSMDGKNPPSGKLTGPLAMYPGADDNYGSSSCSVTSLGGSGGPTLLVLATSTNRIYHCLLLPSSEKEGDSHALYVLESVELNITLTAEEQDLQYNYPLHLYPWGNISYLVVHAGGVHCVTVSVLEQLQQYAMADEAESESILSSICTSSSSVRYMLSTSVVGARAPDGVACCHPGRGNVYILSPTGDLVVRSLEPFGLLQQLYKEMPVQSSALQQDDIKALIKENQKVSFTAIMQEILRRDTSQPILNIYKQQGPNTQECLELLSLSVSCLRGEYMRRQQSAARTTRRKLTALAARRDSLQTQQLMAEIEQVKAKSASLREKCLLAEKQQEDIKYRCSAVIRQLRSSAPTSGAERELLDELNTYNSRRQHLQDLVLELKKQAAVKKDELLRWQEEYKKKDVNLGKSHSETISSILQQQTSLISTLIEDTKLLKDQLSIV